MRTYDLTPLFRTSVGFDRMSRLMESALQLEGAAKGYPPYNIVRKEQDQYPSHWPWPGLPRTNSASSSTTTC